MEDILSDSEVEDINTRAGSHVTKASSLINNLFLYDTGASYHFIRNKCNFISIHKLEKPFKFDQAIGESSLKYQGTS